MKKFILLLLIAISFSSALHAQSALVRSGNRHYNALAYTKAIPYYMRALAKDSTLEEAIFKLAECYRLTNNSKQAEYWFGKAVVSPGVKPVHKFHYGRALMSNGKYKEAADWFKKQSSSGNSAFLLKTIDDYTSLYADSADYAVSRLAINSPNADFGAVLFRDGIVFASSRKVLGAVERRHAWTGQPFLDLFYSKGKGTSFSEPVRLSSELKTKYNDGPACFSADGQSVWFTRNDASGKTTSKGEPVKLKIFNAQANGMNGWKDIQPFPFNSNAYNCAHPSISADGKRLYFASDMDGSMGGMDIYYCQYSDSGWGKPVNVGPTVNTVGNDLFPSINVDNTLYFASDGWGGLGGLDIFISTFPQNGKQNPLNAGYPVNTTADDFFLQFDTKNNTGYFSSNRTAGGFDDDLFSFTRTAVSVRGIVVEKSTGNPVNMATVELQSGDQLFTVTTSENGTYNFKAEFGKDYTVQARKEGMGMDSASFDTRSVHPGQPFIRLELGPSDDSGHKIYIQAIDAKTRQPLPGALIRNPDTEEVIGSTGIDGIYSRKLIPEKDERFLVTMEGYRSKLIRMEGQAGEQPQDMRFIVEMVPTGIGYPYNEWYKIIYYDLDKFNIRGDARPILDEVAEFLKANRNITISITSSTDSRASVEYNERLSKNRSISVRDYLVSKGVKASQLARIRWTGESTLVNECNDFAPCTEEMHQLNRRSEMVIVEVE